MKTKIFLFLITSLLASCGKDGKDGNCYMAVSKGGMCISSYWDDNSCLPTPCNYEQNYGPCEKTNERVKTFNYNFYFCNGSGYKGTYSIGFSLAKGKEGGFLVKGEDGDDKYFKMTMGNGGLTTTVQRTNSNDFFSVFDTSKTEIDCYVLYKNAYMHIVGKKVFRNPSEPVESKIFR